VPKIEFCGNTQLEVTNKFLEWMGKNVGRILVTKCGDIRPVLFDNALFLSVEYEELQPDSGLSTSASIGPSA
jgi:hypothetical protein